MEVVGAMPVDGGVHFRIWAPATEIAEVVLYDDGGTVHRLNEEPGGYFAAMVPGAAAGSRYRFRLDGESYPDPASRSQPEGVHGPSEVMDPASHVWQVNEWPAHRVEDLVIYELHIGTFTPGGTFDSAIERLPEVAALGINAVEPLPIANFPGTRNWGYDGVYLYSPATSYGGYDAFKRFVDAAHGLGLSVILDVVYNHFGPEGNYLPAVTGGRFFTDRHHTPWGDAINYDGPGSRAVRDFIIQNALYWLTEHRVDGLRLDATHAIIDDSPRHLLAELSDRVAKLPGHRRLLIAEDERNARGLVETRERGGHALDAVWSDDLHHQLRRMVARDSEGYFAAYSGTVEDAARTLETGWWRNSDDAAELRPSAFVHCIQNHDQVGNRALGDRLNHSIDLPVYRALSTLLLTSPYVPLLWMGQEWAASTPFLYFTDHPEELGKLVTRGRREEFAHFSAFSDPVAAASIPDPQAVETFERSTLRWEERGRAPHSGILRLYTDLLKLRSAHPALRAHERGSFDVAPVGAQAIVMRRIAEDGSVLLVVMNFDGVIGIDLNRWSTGTPGANAWRLVLATEDESYGGNGAWGRLEGVGILDLRTSGAVIVETAS
jgi:maltooligosyltrehalose trehalohydrolase